MEQLFSSGVHYFPYYRARASLRCSVLLTQIKHQSDLNWSIKKTSGKRGNTAQTSNFHVAPAPTRHKQVNQLHNLKQQSNSVLVIENDKKEALKMQYNLPHGHSYPSKDTMAVLE